MLSKKITIIYLLKNKPIIYQHWILFLNLLSLYKNWRRLNHLDPFSIYTYFNYKMTSRSNKTILNFCFFMGTSSRIMSYDQKSC
jgi:hypothetical protein